MKKMVVSMFMLLFCLCITGCKKDVFKIYSGTYTFECKDYYAEMIVTEIDVNQYIESKGINVIKIEEDNQYFYLEFNIVYIDTQEKIRLDFYDLKTERISKITFSNYVFFDNNYNRIVTKKTGIRIGYKNEEIHIEGDFKLQSKNN